VNKCCLDEQPQNFFCSIINTNKIDKNGGNTMWWNWGATCKDICSLREVKDSIREGMEVNNIINFDKVFDRVYFVFFPEPVHTLHTLDPDIVCNG